MNYFYSFVGVVTGATRIDAMINPLSQFGVVASPKSRGLSGYIKRDGTRVDLP